MKYHYLLGLLPILALAGCGSSSYTVLERTEGSAQVGYQIQVPSGSSMSDMQGWARELEQKESGKPVMVNFYNSSTISGDNLLVSCESGNCADMQAIK